MKSRLSLDCRSCGSHDLRRVLSLGELPLANALVETPDKEVARFPLDLDFCPACALVQIGCAVEPETLFRDYPYFSSVSDTMILHASRLAKEAAERKRLGPRSLAVEVASNDGYLLRTLVRRGIPVLGIEPARNVAQVARARGVETIEEFFTEDLARRLAAEGRRADVLFALNVLGHVPDPNDFLRGVRAILKRNGLAVFEFGYVRDLVERVAFDTIYHEHVSYFSATSAARLLARHGLGVRRVERIAAQGGSLRIWASLGAHGDAGALLRDEESAAGLTGAGYYSTFSDRVDSARRRLKSMLLEIKRRGGSVAGYGAAAKATILLNACGIDRSVVEFVADRSPYKQGKYIPGTGIPIVAPEEFDRRRPDVAVLFAWNLAPEIAAQQSGYLEAGGRFVLPLPEPRLVRGLSPEGKIEMEGSACGSS